MDDVYILSYVVWKRLGDGCRPRMVDCGINGIFSTKDNAIDYLVRGWPEALYDPERDDYCLELENNCYARYRIRYERLVY